MSRGLFSMFVPYESIAIYDNSVLFSSKTVFVRMGLIFEKIARESYNNTETAEIVHIL